MIDLYRAKKYCIDVENIENYEIAVNSEEVWNCHHRLETHTSDGERRLVDITKEELIALNMYYNRPAEELIFLTTKEHNSLHHKGKVAWNKGKPLSEETKRKMSAALKGRPAWNKEKHHSDESKAKVSKANKGRYKGKHWKLVDGKRVWY